MAIPQIGRAIRLMNMEKNATPTVAQFEALLADTGRLDALVLLLQRRGAAQQIAACSNLTTALFKGGSIPSSAYPAVAKAFASSADSMRMVLSDAAIFTAFFAVPEAKAALLASTALAPAAVPVMTSDTTPSGIVSASTYHSDGYAPWMAFDKDPATYWQNDRSLAINEEWITYKFVSPAFVSKVAITQSIDGYRVKDVDIQRSSDGSSFQTVASATLLDVAEQHIAVESPGFYRHWRLKVNSDYGEGYCVFHSLDFSGFFE